jgi:hypothetical protein
MMQPSTETALQREQRLYRELSSHVIDVLVSKVFDLRPEKAARRRMYQLVIFILSGIPFILAHYPLQMWTSYIRDIFYSALAPSQADFPLNIAIANFLGFLRQVFLDPKILQYLPVFIAPYFIALQSAAIYLADIFELDNVSVARRFVSGVALTGSDETIRVKNGEVADEYTEAPTYLIGGPGKVVVELDSVALFERADGTPHVIGPTGKQPGGKATLEGFERFRQALDIRNHHVDLRDQDPKLKAVQSRSLDGIPIKATDVRLMFSVYRGENPETSAENPYPFSKEAVEQIVFNATSRVTPEQVNPSTFEFNWTQKMPVLIRGKLGGFMGEHKLSEYLAGTGMPEFEKATQREDKIFEQKQQFPQSSDDMPGRKEVKLPPDFQARYKIKNLFAQFAEGFSSQARSNGVELQWIGVGTWESPVEIVPDKHLEAWKITQENLKNDSAKVMNKIEQDEIIEKTKELIQKVPIDAFEEITNAYKSSKKWGKHAPKKKEHHRLQPHKQNDDDDQIFPADEMAQFAEVLHLLQDIKEEKPEEVEPSDTDHAHDVQALLLEYRKQFQKTVDLIRDKKEEVPQNILDAIKHIDNQIGHWAGRP